MDIEELKTALNLSLSSNEEIRKQNADIILRARQIPTFGPLLLRISADTNNPFEIQQNASIQLKNFVKSYWKFGENSQINMSLLYEEDEKIIVISENDKAFMRDNIFEAFLSNQSKLIRKQYCECIKKIAKFELSNKFSFIIDKIIECFNSNEDEKIFAGIIIFYTIAKTFSLDSGDLKTPYVAAFQKVHDYLLNFIPNLLENFNNEKACLIMYYIIKTYYLSTTLKLEEIIKVKPNIEKWLHILIVILDKKYSGDLIKKTEKTEEIKILSDNVYWKIKFYCMKIFNNYYAKYSFVGRNVSEVSIEFTNVIKNTFAEKFYDCYLKILFHSKDEFLPDQCGGYIFRFFCDTLSNNHLINKLEENLDTILKDFLIQSVFLKLEDIELWKNDVKSFLVKQFNFLEGFNSLRNNAIKFANELCRHKRKLNNGKKEKYPIYFESVYKFFVSVLEIYDDHVKNGLQTDFRIKEAVLTIIENVCSSIHDYSYNTIEKFIELFIINELKSNNPFIRIRSYMVLYSFKSYKYNNIDNLKLITDHIFQSLCDENLSIRVFASICAPTFFGNKEIKPKLDQHISQIISIYINLMNEVDLEEILISLEYIVQTFNEKIKDFVVDLTKILTDRFMKISRATDEENLNTNSPIIKEGIIKTLICIIGIFRKHEELFAHIYEHVREIIRFGFLDDGVENYEDSLDLIMAICKEGERIYSGVWEFYIPIIESIIGTPEEIEFAKAKEVNSIFIGSGFDCFDSLINNLLLFITKDIDIFLNGVPDNNLLYVQRSILLVHNTIIYSKSNKEYGNIRSAFKIITAIIESAKGKIDGLYTQFVLFFISQLEDKLTKEHKNALIELCASCFIYNPHLMINILAENKLLEKVLDFWISKNNFSQYEVHKNKTLIAIVSIITLNPKDQHPLISMNMKLLLDSLIYLVRDKYEDFDDILEEIHSEKTNFEVEDEEIHHKNSVNEEQTANHFDILEDDYLEENDDDSEWDQLEFLNELTIIEKINPTIYLRDGLSYIQNNFGDFYDDLIKMIGNEDLKILKDCIKKTENAIQKK